jgi:hypothetical protein
MSLIRTYRELDVYKGAMALAKLSDSGTEAAESQVSAEIPMRRGNWDGKTFREIDELQKGARADCQDREPTGEMAHQAAQR